MRQGWDEFHKYMKPAREKDTRWPYDAASDRRYRRRAEFVRLVEEEARTLGKLPDDHLNDLEKKEVYRKKSIHYICSEMKKLKLQRDSTATTIASSSTPATASSTSITIQDIAPTTLVTTITTATTSTITPTSTLTTYTHDNRVGG
ncbi:hypothetical protein BGZ76_005480, partial [Entomortierella beljakovae]